MAGRVSNFFLLFSKTLLVFFPVLGTFSIAEEVHQKLVRKRVNVDARGEVGDVAVGSSNPRRIKDLYYDTSNGVHEDAHDSAASTTLTHDHDEDARRRRLQVAAQPKPTKAKPSAVFAGLGFTAADVIPPAILRKKIVLAATDAAADAQMKTLEAHLKDELKYSNVQRIPGCANVASCGSDCASQTACLNSQLDAIENAYSSGGSLLIYRPEMALKSSTNGADPGLAIVEARIINFIALGYKLVSLEAELSSWAARNETYVAVPAYTAAAKDMGKRICARLTDTVEDRVLLITKSNAQSDDFYGSWQRELGFKEGLLQHCSTSIYNNLITVSVGSALEVDSIVDVLFRTNKNIKAVFAHDEKFLLPAIDAAKRARDAGTTHYIWASGTGEDDAGEAYEQWKNGILDYYTLKQTANEDFGLIVDVAKMVKSYLNPPSSQAAVPRILNTDTFLRTLFTGDDLLAHITAGKRLADNRFSNVTVDYDFQEVSLNIPASEFTVRVEIDLNWFDARCQWDSRWGVDNMVLPVNMPEIICHPSVSPTSFRKLKVIRESFRGFRRGKMEFLTLLEATFPCDFNLRSFPSDSQTCTGVFEDQKQDQTVLNATSAAYKEPQVFLQGRLKGNLVISGFTAKHFDSFVAKELRSFGFAQTEKTVFGFTMQVDREPAKYFYLIVFPCFVLAMVSTLLFKTEVIVPRIFCPVITIVAAFQLQTDVFEQTPPDSSPDWCRRWFTLNIVYMVILLSCFIMNWDSVLWSKVWRLWRAKVQTGGEGPMRLWRIRKNAKRTTEKVDTTAAGEEDATERAAGVDLNTATATEDQDDIKRRVEGKHSSSLPKEDSGENPRVSGPAPSSSDDNYPPPVENYRAAAPVNNIKDYSGETTKTAAAKNDNFDALNDAKSIAHSQALSQWQQVFAQLAAAQGLRTKKNFKNLKRTRTHYAGGGAGPHAAEDNMYIDPHGHHHHQSHHHLGNTNNDNSGHQHHGTSSVVVPPPNRILFGDNINEDINKDDTLLGMMIESGEEDEDDMLDDETVDSISMVVFSIIYMSAAAIIFFEIDWSGLA